MGDAGCKNLAGALASNQTLRKLEISLNKIGNDGARALAESPGLLKKLDLSANLVSDAGAKALAKMLHDNKTLEELE